VDYSTKTDKSKEMKSFKQMREDAPANAMGAAGISGLGTSTGGIAGRDKILGIGDPNILRRKALELLKKKYEKS
jgi:hypothetical protein